MYIRNIVKKIYKNIVKKIYKNIMKKIYKKYQNHILGLDNCLVNISAYLDLKTCISG